MGKRFGQLGVHIRGVFYYVLSHHEMKAYANAITKGIPNIYYRTSSTIWRWLPTFFLSYLVYRYTECRNKASHRKNPKDYANEKEPPPPLKICVRRQEPVPFCRKDWVFEEYPCAPGEEPDEEMFRGMRAKAEKQAAKEAAAAESE